MAESWLQDLILPELKKAGPEGLSKEELQARVGLGSDDLRTAIQQGLGGGAVEGREDGRLAYGQAPERASDGGPLPAAEEPATEDEPGEPGEVVDRPRYEAAILVQVGYFPDGEGDERAVEDAREIQQAAADGILSAWPDLAVSTRILGVEAYDRARHVYPPAPPDPAEPVDDGAE